MLSSTFLPNLTKFPVGDPHFGYNTNCQKRALVAPTPSSEVGEKREFWVQWTRLLCQASHEDFVSSLPPQNLDMQNPFDYTKGEKSGSNFQVSKREPEILSTIPPPPTNKKRRRSKNGMDPHCFLCRRFKGISFSTIFWDRPLPHLTSFWTHIQPFAVLQT